MTNEQFREKVGKKIIKLMEEGKNPFVVPYVEANEKKGNEELAKTYPINYLTNKIYTGYNQFLIPAGYYLTFKQASELGGKIKTGAKAERGYYRNFSVKDVEDTDSKSLEKIQKELEKNPNIKMFWWGEVQYLLNEETEKWQRKFAYETEFYVFNINDIENLKVLERENNDEFKPVIAEADAIVTNYTERENFTVKYGTEPTVSFEKKEIIVPDRSRYKNDSDYYQILFNTVSASTAEKLKRYISGRYGSQSYSKEMLTNEIASILLLASCGLITQECQANSGAYLREWARIIQGNDLANKIAFSINEGINAYKEVLGRD